MAKILVIGKYYPPFSGGVETNTADIAEALAARHDVTALVNHHANGQSEDIVNGVRVIRARVDFKLSSQPVSAQFASKLDPSRYDLVHFHAPNPYASAFLLARLNARTPLVITHHMEITGRALLRGLSLPLYHALVKRARAVIVTSAKNAGISLDLPRGARVQVIPLGLDPANYDVSDSARAAAMAWRRGLAGDAPCVVFLGRHARYKGLSVLIEALAALPGIHALIGGEGPHRRAAEAEAARLGLRDRVHFLGHLDHAGKVRLLLAGDVYAFPSTETTEAFGISQVEAMLCGAPVVASDLPTGVTDIAIDGRTALLAPPGDPRLLARQIGRLLADRVLAARLSAQGRAHALAQFHIDRMRADSLALFERVLAEAPPRSARAPSWRDAVSHS